MKKWSNILTLLLTFLFIISQLVEIPFMIYIISTLTAIIIVISIIYSVKLPKIFGIAMLIIGGIIMIVQRQPLEVWMEAITKNLPLASLIILVPILGIPINIGRYQDKLAGFVTRISKKTHILYLFISILYLIFAPLVNLGSIHIIHSMLEKLKLPKNLLGRVYVRGFTSVHTWSPYFASVFLVVLSLDLSISEYLPYGFILSFFQILTGYLLFLLVEQKHIRIDRLNRPAFESPKEVVELFIFVFLMIGLIFTLEKYININDSVLIMLIVSIFAIIWSLYLSTPKVLLEKLNEFRDTNIPLKANEINLLLIAGFFSYVLSKTTATQFINSWWGGVANYSVLLVIATTIILVSFLSFLGVHQIVSISAIIATVSYEQFGIHIITMAMMLLSSWALSATVSIVSPVNIIISNLLKVNILKLIFRWNLLYAIIITVVHTFVIYIVHLILSS